MIHEDDKFKSRMYFKFKSTNIFEKELNQIKYFNYLTQQ